LPLRKKRPSAGFSANKTRPPDHYVSEWQAIKELDPGKRVSKGDDKPERFILHLKPLQGALEAFCRRGLYDVSVVEDVLQEVMARAFRDFGLFSEGTNFRAWIFRYVNLGILEANRRCLDRKHQPLDVEPAAVEDEWKLGLDESLLHVLIESPEIILESCEEDLQRAVLQLRPADRTVLLLKAIGDFKYREIAEIVGVPMGTVMSSLARARQQVRSALTRHGDEHGTSLPQTDDSRHKNGP
jgi:RNA polymerase sigma-70 factor (ECF subfamily)